MRMIILREMPIMPLIMIICKNICVDCTANCTNESDIFSSSINFMPEWTMVGFAYSLKILTKKLKAKQGIEKDMD